ncbi:VENN motif pre-toxin domain-containing protein, partial [Avibacterium endocarditidis]|uniref:VENN motif pre-toxin domain-containing protein n=1 Tax=Avibacterium TaxID=292486 RepID=UPI0039FD96EE
TGEATAQYLTKALYNKAPSELTASEKETISSLSQLAGGLAGAFTAKANGSMTIREEAFSPRWQGLRRLRGRWRITTLAA